MSAHSIFDSPPIGSIASWFDGAPWPDEVGADVVDGRAS